MKIYAGVTGNLFEYTPELQVKTKCKVIDFALKDFHNQPFKEQNISTISQSNRLKTYAGVTGNLFEYTLELQVKNIRRSYRQKVQKHTPELQVNYLADSLH